MFYLSTDVIVIATYIELLVYDDNFDNYLKEGHYNTMYFTESSVHILNMKNIHLCGKIYENKTHCQSS